jgi:hypothetical protein
MNNWQLLLKPAKRQLLWLAAALVTSMILVAGSRYYRDELHANLGQTQGQLTSQQSALAEKQQDLDNIQTHIKEFNSLKQKGLVGLPDREDWVEQLPHSRAAVRAADTLTYILGPPQSVVDLTGTAAASGTDTSVTTYDLEFELKETHEFEVLKLLAHYRETVHGRFRIESCALSNAMANGLVARCKLRFFSLPETEATKQ